MDKRVVHIRRTYTFDVEISRENYPNLNDEQVKIYEQDPFQAIEAAEFFFQEYEPEVSTVVNFSYSE